VPAERAVEAAAALLALRAATDPEALDAQARLFAEARQALPGSAGPREVFRAARAAVREALELGARVHCCRHWALGVPCRSTSFVRNDGRGEASPGGDDA